MKIYNDKGYRVMRYLMMVTLFLCALSCEQDLVTYDVNDDSEQQVADPYVRIITPVVGFIAGTEKYGFTYNVINGLKEVSAINVYSTFTDAATEEGPGATSNEVLLGTYPITSSTISFVTDTITYEDLKEGLTVDGEPLPESDVDLSVGAGWQLRFEGVLASGGTIPLSGAINIAVLSRFAGIYRMEELVYYRIGVRRDDVTDPEEGEEIFIGSVDENTFSHNGWWGPFPWPGCAFNFDVDFSDNSITAPILTPCGVYNGADLITCAANPTDLTNVNCGTSNKLVINDVTGGHEIYLSYGYAVAGASREFYAKLVKVVE